MNKQPDSGQFDIRKRIQDSFDEIKNELNESVVFVDPISSLVLSWGIPYDNLLNQYNIEHIFSLESVPPHISVTSKKVVFFLSSFLYDSSKYIVSVLQSFSFLQCNVFTAFSEAAHKSLPQKEEEPFARFAGLFSNLMNQNDNSPSVSIKVLPLLSCTSMFPGMFLLSSCNDVFPVVKSELIENAMRLTSEMVPDNMKIKLTGLAHCLYDTFTWLGLKEEMYPLGPTARYVAKEINSISLTNNPLDIAQPHLTPASLILIDRTLDMVSPSLHSDNLLDRIYTILSEDEVSRDVKFPMGNLFPTMLPQVPSGGVSGVSGTLAHPGSQTSTSILEVLATKKEKEAITEIVKKIVEILTKEKLPFNLPKAGSSGVRQLLPLMEVFGKDRIIFYRYLSVLQCVSAVVTAIQESPKHNWDEVLGIEKTLLLTLEDTSQSLISRVNEILGRPIPGSITGTKFSLREIISLALLSYSIMGEKSFDQNDEQAFQEGILKSLFELPQQDVQWLGNSVESLNQYLIQLNKNDQDKDKLTTEVTKSLNDIFSKFRFIANARSNLTDYRTLLKPTNKGLSYIPLVQQVVSSLFDEKRELHDLDRLGSNASIGNILKTGFSKFGLGGLSKPAKSKPSENSIIVIFVIGGITFSEMREIRDALKTKSQVIIASTRIATPLSVYKMALNQ